MIQPRFMAYMVAHDIDDPSQIDNHEYMIWIMDQIRIFKSDKGLPISEPMDQRMQDEFTEWLTRFLPCC